MPVVRRRPPHRLARVVNHRKETEVATARPRRIAATSPSIAIAAATATIAATLVGGILIIVVV